MNPRTPSRDSKGSVSKAALIRLRNDYEAQAIAASRQSAQSGPNQNRWRAQKAVLDGVVMDLSDLINDKEHPSARRG